MGNQAEWMNTGRLRDSESPYRKNPAKVPAQTLGCFGDEPRLGQREYSHVTPPVPAVVDGMVAASPKRHRNVPKWGL